MTKRGLERLKEVSNKCDTGHEVIEVVYNEIVTVTPDGKAEQVKTLAQIALAVLVGTQDFFSKNTKQ